MSHPFSLCFLMFSMRVFWVSGHLPMLSHIGVAANPAFVSRNSCSQLFVLAINQPMQLQFWRRSNNFQAVTRLQFLTRVEFFYVLQFSRCVRSVQRTLMRKLLDPDTGRWSAIVRRTDLMNMYMCTYLYVYVYAYAYMYVYMYVYM